MKHAFKYIVCVFFSALFFISCEKNDYINDGGVHDPHVNMTTYDFLNSHPKFDSLVRIIDKAGLKDAVNGNVTFYATTNWGVADYVSAKKQKRIIELGDENISFNIDDLDVGELQDSMRMYIFDGEITRENLSTDGALYESHIGSDMPFLLGLRRTRDWSQYLDYVDYLYYTWVKGTRDDLETSQSNIPEAERDERADIQTSGIITTTGIIHVLDGNHRLFFNDEPTAN